MITVGNIAEKQYVALDGKGYLCIADRAEKFKLSDLDGAPLLKNQLPGERVVHVRDSSNISVMLFEGEDGFEDDDIIYNFLIAGRKIKHQTENKGVFYTVPAGDGTWKQYPADKAFVATPTPLLLRVL